MSQYTPAQTALTEELRRIASLEDVARALGIKDIASQDEEFWSSQRRAATSRFFMMLLHNQKLDLAIRREELDDDTAYALREKAAAFVSKLKVDYAYIRQWFLNYGQYAYNAALARRKEREHLASMVLRLLVVHPEKGASYLAYNGVGTPILVAAMDMAHTFPVHSASELKGEYLAEMSKHFVAIQTMFNAKSVKLLAGPRTA
jgi:hypothetical protein